MDWSKVRRVFRIERFRPDPASEVDDELAFHLEETVRELRESGRSPEEADREAHRRFGQVRWYRRELESMERRASQGWARRVGDATSAVAQTASSAVRSLVRRPGFSVTVVATLALGLGVNVAMFRIVDRLLLSPPEHIADGDEVRKLYLAAEIGDETLTQQSVSFPDFQDLRGVSGFLDVAASTSRELVLGEGTESALVRAGVASGDFFALLGVEPARGRFFGIDDDRTASPGAAVVSWEYWQGAWGRDPNVLGREVRIGNGRYTVIGVAPRGFTGVDLSPVDFWIPLQPYAVAEEAGPWRENRDFVWLHAVARLAPGVTEDAALEEATAVLRGAVDGSPERAEAFVRGSSLIAADGAGVGGEVGVAGALGAVSLIVLLISCANVANLLLGRDLRRRRELAVRAALGSGRRRLVAQHMAETGLLALLGGVAGVVLAAQTGGIFQRILLPDVAFSQTLLDPRIVGFAAIAVALSTVLAGAIPAIQASRSDLGAALKSGGDRTGTPRTRTQLGLLLFQSTLCVVLLTGAGVFVRSLTNVQAVDLGFETRGLSLVELDFEGAPSLLLPPLDAEPVWPPDDNARAYELAEERIAALPGVRAAALVNPTPFMMVWTMPFDVPGLDSIPRGAAGPFPLAMSSDYLEVMGLDLVAGRGIQADDDRMGAAPVTVLNRTMAELLWPGETAVGRCVRPGGAEAPCTTVIGVVEDSHRSAILEPESQMVYYLPIHQQILRGSPTSIFVRTVGADPGALRAAAQTASPLIRFARVQPFSALMEPELRPWRLGASVFGAFGVLALLVASLGLYSVFAFDVTGRRRELGVRTALGASGRSLFALVVRDAAVLMIGGIALGLLLVLLARPFVDPLLYETSALDPRVAGPAAAIFLGVALVAAALPGGRAARSSPVEILRTE